MNNKHIPLIRLERPEDYLQTENVVREAFWDVYKPGCSEHLILHKIRTTSVFIKELTLVACVGKKIVGMVVCLKGIVKNEFNQEITLLSMMVGVLPSYQKQGIGSMLIRNAIDVAKSLDYKGIVLFGNPDYYSRFGFRNAKEYSIQTSDGENFDQFMALELSENSLNGISGRFYEDPVFQPITDIDELESFDLQFPHKEKHITDTQLKI